MKLKATLIAGFLVFATSAHSQSTAEKIQQLEQMIEELQSALTEARGEIRQIREHQQEADSDSGIDSGVVVSTNGGLKVEDKEGGNEFKFGGNIMYDYDFYDGIHNEDKGGEDASEGEFRRTRVTASGKVKHDWKYKFTIDIIEDDDTAFTDAYIQYTGLKPMDITVGKFKEPFSLEQLGSSKWLPAIERSMLQDVIFKGRPDAGVMLSGYYENANHLNWAIGIFDDGDEDEDGEDTYAVTGRVAMAPHFGDKHFLHLGAAYSVRDLEESEDKIETRFGVHTVDRTPLGTSDAIDDVDQWGLEAAYVNGPFSLQGEYIDVEMDGGTAMDDMNTPDNTADDITYNANDLGIDGYYLQAAYTLTGETRGYKTKGAKFDKISPSGQWGAWEVVTRYEEVEVDDDTDKADAEKWLVGLNWYVNKNVKFMLNYLDAELDGHPEVTDNDDGDAVSLRAQYVW